MVGRFRGYCSARRYETSRNVTSWTWWVPAPPGGSSYVELSSTTLCSQLGLLPHVGRGDAAVVRSIRSESFFDLITNKITKLPQGRRLVGSCTRAPGSDLRLQVYLVKKPVNFGPHFLVNESETR